MRCLAWPARRWNNTACIQIPPSQPVCRPRGGFALAVPPGYQCVLRFIALISSTPSYYKHVSERSSKHGGERAGRRWRVWYSAFENKEVWGKDQNGNDPALPSCSRVLSCTRLPIMRGSWHRGHRLYPLVLPNCFPTGAEDFKGPKGSGQLNMERGCPPGQLSTLRGRGLYLTPTTPYPFAWGMPQGLLKARGVERALGPDKKVQAGPVNIRKA